MENCDDQSRYIQLSYWSKQFFDEEYLWWKHLSHMHRSKFLSCMADYLLARRHILQNLEQKLTKYYSKNYKCNQSIYSNNLTYCSITQKNMNSCNWSNCRDILLDEVQQKVNDFGFLVSKSFQLYRTGNPVKWKHLFHFCYLKN